MLKAKRGTHFYGEMR
jgi:predicted RNA-binding protein with RPS1 domain